MAIRIRGSSSHRNPAAGVTPPAAILVIAIVKNAASGARGLARP